MISTLIALWVWGSLVGVFLFPSAAYPILSFFVKEKYIEYLLDRWSAVVFLWILQFGVAAITKPLWVDL